MLRETPQKLTFLCIKNKSADVQQNIVNSIKIRKDTDIKNVLTNSIYVIKYRKRLISDWQICANIDKLYLSKPTTLKHFMLVL